MAPLVGGPIVDWWSPTHPGWTREHEGKRNGEEKEEIVRAAASNSKAATKPDST